MENTTENNMPQEPIHADAPESESASVITRSDKYAKAGFILGLVSIVAWIIPIVGLPVTICAIVFSSLGLKSMLRHKKAVAGLTLGIVFLVVTVINSVIGALVLINSLDTTSNQVPDTLPVSNVSAGVTTNV